MKTDTMTTWLLGTLGTLMLVGSTAYASTSSIWSDSVQSASQLAENAKAQINRSSDCHGLNKILVFGVSESGGLPSDSLGELRNQLEQLDLISATVEFATVAGDPSDASARDASKDALSQINGLKNEVTSTLVAKLKYCGNGVEKGPQR